MGYLGSVVQDALRVKYKGSEYVCGETYESLQWLDTVVPKPTEEQLLLDIEDYKANRQTYEYDNLRRNEYPPVEEQLDMLWKAMDSGQLPKADGFYNRIRAVKDKYPKGESNGQ